jgi:hypothetical protein
MSTEQAIGTLGAVLIGAGTGLIAAIAVRWRHEAEHWRRRYEDLVESERWAKRAMKSGGDLN